MKGFNKGDIGKALIVCGSDRIRTNGFKLDKIRFNEEIGKNWFANRVVDEWNRLGRHGGECKNYGLFKEEVG